VCEQAAWLLWRSKRHGAPALCRAGREGSWGRVVSLGWFARSGLIKRGEGTTKTAGADGG
jgi:hypothetical protein